VSVPANFFRAASWFRAASALRAARAIRAARLVFVAFLVAIFVAFLIAIVVAIWFWLVATLAPRAAFSLCMIETSHGPERSRSEIVSRLRRDARADRQSKIAR
jgi:fatty acid desaturase